MLFACKSVVSFVFSAYLAHNKKINIIVNNSANDNCNNCP
jgi:hypothetical protein